MIYEPSNIDLFKEKAQLWASSFSTVCILDSNNYSDPFGSISLMIAIEKTSEFKSDKLQNFRDLQNFLNKHPKEIIPGYLTYDLEAYFFIPKYLLTFEKDKVEIKATDPLAIINAIELMEIKVEVVNFHGSIKNRMSRQEYGTAFQKLQEHIFKGDIYEINLCQEFYSENSSLNCFAAYKELNSISPTPFSCFLKHENNFIISASPERFLSKRGEKLISQPIKGTAPRGKTPQEDNEIKNRLRNDLKEISENIMIVDLVRNDLTKSAKAGTVKVEELLGLYSFKQVHQLISTISCTIKPGIESTTAIQNTFPPGSMTGAPKISAMNLISQYEKGSRGLYAGSIGYFNENNDFDFNVVIRTLIYNSKTKYLSFHVGGAITAYADENAEYQECLLKASAINKLLS